MSTAVKKLLESFDALSQDDKQRAALEIVRRVSPIVDGDLPESALIEAAEELFRSLDTEEAGHAQR